MPQMAEKQIFNNTCLQIMIGLLFLLAHGDTVHCILQFDARLKVIPELTVPTRQAQTHFTFDLLYLLSHTEDRLPLQLSFYG